MCLGSCECLNMSHHVTSLNCHFARSFCNGSFGSEFRRSVSLCSYGGLKSQDMEILWAFLRFFLKTTPYGKIFKILLQMFTLRHRSTLICSNVYICPTKNRWNLALFTWQKIRLPLKLLLLCGSRPKSAWASPNHVLTVLQVSSKSVHFQRSYSRTREHVFAP